MGTDIKLRIEDIVVAMSSPTGPYLVSLLKGYAEDLVEEGQVILVDDNDKPVYTKTFHVRFAHGQTGEPSGLRMTDKVLSIF